MPPGAQCPNGSRGCRGQRPPGQPNSDAPIDSAAASCVGHAAPMCGGWPWSSISDTEVFRWPCKRTRRSPAQRSSAENSRRIGSPSSRTRITRGGAPSHRPAGLRLNSFGVEATAQAYLDLCRDHDRLAKLTSFYAPQRAEVSHDARLDVAAIRMQAFLLASRTGPGPPRSRPPSAPARPMRRGTAYRVYSNPLMPFRPSSNPLVPPVPTVALRPALPPLPPLPITAALPPLPPVPPAPPLPTSRPAVPPSPPATKPPLPPSPPMPPSPSSRALPRSRRDPRSE